MRARLLEFLRRDRLAVLLLGIFVSAIPSFRTAVRCNGFDVRAYIGAAYALEQDRPLYTGRVVVRKMRVGTGEIREMNFPPFLYHPAVAMAYQGMLRLSDFRWTPVIHATNLAGFALFSLGLIALLLAAGLPPWVAGLAQAVFWWCPMAPFPLALGNIGPVVSGATLLGAAALLRRRFALAGALFGCVILFKPAAGLILVALAGAWRPRPARPLVELLLAWISVQVAAVALVASGPGLATLSDYGTNLRHMGANAWTMAYYDGSIGASLLRSISPWRPAYHEMVVHAWNANEAILGQWLHEDLRIMQAANGIGLVAFASVVFLRRRDLAGEPVLLAGLAVVAGFLFQPANWPHNYGMLLIVPAGILHLRTRSMGAIEGSIPSEPRPDRLLRLAVAASVLILLMMSPILRLVRLEPIRPPRERTEEPLPAELVQWHFARIAASLPAIWLPGLAATLFLAAGSRREEEMAPPAPAE